MRTNSNRSERERKGFQRKVLVLGTLLLRWISLLSVCGLLVVIVRTQASIAHNDNTNINNNNKDAYYSVDYENQLQPYDDFSELPRLGSKIIIRQTNHTTNNQHRPFVLHTTYPAATINPNVENLVPLPPLNKKRIITLVHVGKAGGMTVRSATSLMCRLNTRKYNTRDKVDECISRFLPSPSDGQLAHLTQYYVHMHAWNATELAQSTSFLFSLRNPVDRVISTFRYSHPVNCNQPVYQHKAVRPWGCEAEKHVNNPYYPEYLLYKICFPSAAMEAFAQSAMSPFAANDLSSSLLSIAQQHECRWIGRLLVQGQWQTIAAPHMKYNYDYYRNLTIGQYPNKEILGVRTHHAWDDLKALDIAVGGRGLFRRQGRIESHGSETYEPSPLSTEAYHKLCCLLEHEIDVYADLVRRVVNLNETAKQECIDNVRTKCGIQDGKWEEWRNQCRARLEEDRKLLQPFAKERGDFGPRSFAEQT